MRIDDVTDRTTTDTPLTRSHDSEPIPRRIILITVLDGFTGLL